MSYVLIPLELCEQHQLINHIEVDGQNRRVCDDCISMALRVADCNLAPDREYHRHHDIKEVGCPFCYPGAVA